MKLKTAFYTGEAKKKLLRELLENQGSFVSGQMISKKMNVTRAAVWKHVQALNLEGWPIESVVGKGYILRQNTELPYSVEAIYSELAKIRASRLNAKLSHIEDSYDWLLSLHDSLDSTSTLLKEMAEANAPEGSVVIAEAQTGGRGRLGRKWASPPGLGIWMSLLLRPELAPEQIQILTLAASVAVMSALNAHIGGCAIKGMGIKWPNDILWRGRKLCGILTEMAAEADGLSYVVLGIGLNISHAYEDFPEDVREIAVSLKQIAEEEKLEIELDRNKLTALILHGLERVYFLIKDMKPEEILLEWRTLAVTLNRKIQIFDHNSTWDALALDVGLDGRLLVSKVNGEKLWLRSGEISIRDGGL